MILLSQLILFLSVFLSVSTPAAPRVDNEGSCLVSTKSESLQPYIEYLRNPQDSASAEVKTKATGLLTAYAPRVWWHPEESYGAMDPLEFISKSSLRFRTSMTNQGVLAKKGEVLAHELGTSHSGAYARGRHFPNSTDRGLMRSSRLGKEAYSLKYEGESLRGELPAVALWKLSEAKGDSGCLDANGKRSIIIEYWFHSAYNQATRLGIGDHQGDWEGVAMLIEVEAAHGPDGEVQLKHRLKSTYLAAHESGEWHCPNDLGWTEGAMKRPEVFSARGTHATYARAGKHDQIFITDETARGSAWDTWENLRPLVREPYYGYSGAWGEEGVLEFMTGPLVPGPGFKPQPKSGFRAENVKSCTRPVRQLADIDSKEPGAQSKYQ